VDPRRILPAALLLGVVNALVFLGFEYIVNHGTEWIWDDVVGSDEVRWRVIPLAIVLSAVYGVFLRVLREPRVTKVEAHTGLELDDSKPATFRAVWVIWLVGVTGLLAGASLGPEMPLFAGSAGLGLWAAAVVKTPAAKLLALSSAAALLVAFFGSLVPVAIPALLLLRQQRDKFLVGMVPILISSVAAFATVKLLREGNGFGSVPASTSAQVDDYAMAFGLGVAAVLVAALLRWFIVQMNRITLHMERSWPWLVSALVFGAVIGVLYFGGGETVQFSGNDGSQLLIDRADEYTALAVAGIVLVKLLVTAWSLAAGYRGGLVFPSVFAGVAVSVVIVDEWSSVAGPGVTVGGVAGILTAMTSPVLGPILLVALLPFSLLGVALVAAAGAVIGDLLFKRIGLLADQEPAEPQPATP
jgi:H+/Cl- antiporter ClcA